MKNLLDLSAMNPLCAPKGMDGAYVRCGQGISSPDAMYQKHVKNLGDQGLRTGAYLVIQPSQGQPEAQAHNLVTWWNQQGDLPLMIDAERNRPLGADAVLWRDFIKAFVAALPSKPILYTYTSFLSELKAVGLDMSLFQGLFLAQYPQLHYPTPEAEALRVQVIQHSNAYVMAMAHGDATTAHNEIQAKFRAGQALSMLGLDPEPLGSKPNALLWQWGGDANASTVPGCHGLVDRSWFLGDDAAWDAFTSV